MTPSLRRVAKHSTQDFLILLRLLFSRTSQSIFNNLSLSIYTHFLCYRTTVEQVQTVVTCGASLGLPVVARSGGHSYAGYGLGGVDGALVCDLSELKDIQLDGQGSVAVSTGSRLGEVASYLWTNGRLALPHGTCPKGISC